MNEFDALSIAAALSGKSIDEMLVAAQQAGHPDRTENLNRFLSLLDKNYIDGAFALGLPVTITLAGKDHLQQLQDKALAVKQVKRERWIERIWSFFAGVATAVLGGLIIELFS